MTRYVDLQVLEDRGSPKTVSIDREGTVLFHGESPEILFPQEASLYSSFLLRQAPRLAAASGIPLAYSIRVYDPVYAHSTIPKHTPWQATGNAIWLLMQKNCGTLFHCDRVDDIEIYGGLTENGSAFVRVPMTLMDMYYRETILDLLLHEPGVRDDNIHRLAQLMNQVEYEHNPPEHPKPLVVTARQAVRHVGYWRELAGYRPLPKYVDDYDIRVLR